MCLTHSVLIQPCKEGTTVLPTGEMRRPKLRKVKGLPISPWLVSGFDPNSASGPIPSPLHHTRHYLSWGWGANILLPPYLTTWIASREPNCDRAALCLLGHPTFRYPPMLRKDPSSGCSFAVEVADNGKSGRQPFHSPQCQQRSGLCEGPGK